MSLTTGFGSPFGGMAAAPELDGGSAMALTLESELHVLLDHPDCDGGELAALLAEMDVVEHEAAVRTARVGAVAGLAASLPLLSTVWAVSWLLGVAFVLVGAPVMVLLAIAAAQQWLNGAGPRR